MALPREFDMRFNRFRMAVSRFRDITASGELNDLRIRELNALMSEIVELLGMLSRCCEKADKDITLKGSTIGQN